MKKRSLSLLLLLGFITFSGAICRSNQESPKEIILEYWTVQLEDENLSSAITAFQAQYPYVKIEVREYNIDEYEDKLIEAWAIGEGPDIFSVQNSHIGKFADLIEPMPATISITSVETKKSFGKTEIIVTPQTLRTISIQQLGSLFPGVVGDDVVMVHKNDEKDKAAEKIFGLPLSMDTLVLYYNKDMLSQAKIPLPPADWEQFISQVPKLTLVDIDNNIIQSGAALGTSENVPRFFDIVSLLMMQNGATMTTGNNVTFDTEDKTQRDYFPGNRAVEFYTSFANPDVEWYSWNADQPDALESFIAGKAAFFFGYHYHLAEVQRRAPNLNFDITAIPQLDTQNYVNYANYWLETVSVNSPYPNEAWAFIESMTTDKAVATAYLELTQQPSALNSVIQDQGEDYVLNIFGEQALTSQSWYAGKQPSEVEDQFADMITLVNEDRLDIATAVKNTADKVQLTYE